MAILEVLNNKVDKVSRYLRLNSGGSDYYAIPDINTPSDYEIGFNINTTEVTESSLFAFFTASATEELRLVLNSSIGNAGALKLVSAGVTPGAGTKVINDGLTHSIRLIKSGNVFTLIIDGVIDYTINHGNPTLLASSYSVVMMASKSLTSGGVALNAKGVMYDFEYINNGVLDRVYPINDNGSVIIDTKNGQNGSVISGTVDDWGLFTKQGNGDFNGISLEVPPWASASQSLPAA